MKTLLNFINENSNQDVEPLWNNFFDTIGNMINNNNFDNQKLKDDSCFKKDFSIIYYTTYGVKNARSKNFESWKENVIDILSIELPPYI